jgi:uncharacterized protein YcaQ
MRSKSLLEKEEEIPTTLQGIRRLAVKKQHLEGKLPKEGGAREHILSVVRDMTFVQWDPIQVVAPSHILTLWNRIGDFSLSDLEKLLWDEKKLFENWVNFALTLGFTEDYPLYYSMMKRYPESLGKSWGSRKPRTRKFLADNKALGKSILNQLKKKGPLLQNQFEEFAPTKSMDGWSGGSKVSEMLFHLHMSGEVMVVGHEGKRNIWGLSTEFLPRWVEKKVYSEEEVERMSAERAIGSLGTASPAEINYYFPRGRYKYLDKVLESLIEESVIHRVFVEHSQRREKRYVLDRDVKLLESLTDGNSSFVPRVSLLSPFDNLISGRRWTNNVFGFDYSHEMFLPQNKRKFGYYVLPILWGENLIGRIDPVMDRKNGRLVVNSVHAEHGGAIDQGVSTEIGEKIASLGRFLGAKDVVYKSLVPSAWKSSLR